MAAAFAQNQDKADEATNFYKAGMEANPPNQKSANHTMKNVIKYTMVSLNDYNPK
jgi:hypothetical protein